MTMKRSNLFLMTAAALLLAPSAMALSLEERVERLENRSESNLYFDFRMQLNEQQRAIQELQDKMDRLLYREQTLNRDTQQTLQNQQQSLAVLKLQFQELQAQLALLQSAAVVSGPANSVETELSSDALPSESKEVSTENTSVLVIAAKVSHPATKAETREYQAAFRLMSAGEHAAAVQSFTKFIDQYPESELSANALYWLGEAQFIQQQLEPAYQAFKQCIEWFPTSNKAADALNRAIKVQETLKNAELVAALRQELLIRYPDSDVAKQLQASDPQE